MASEAHVASIPAVSSVPPSSRFANRELSWLDFDARVLALAEDNTRPLLERVRFLAIFSINLDEFFQIRVAGLKEQVSVGLASTSPDGMTAREQLDAISRRVRLLMKRQNQIWAKSVRPRLDAAGISVVDWEDLGGDDRVHLRQTFEKRVFPILTPLSVDPAHPFPYISDLSLNLAVVVRDPSTQIRRFARVKVPPNIARFTPLPDGERFIPQEQVISANLDMLFPGMEIVAVHPFRVTRDLDLDLEIDAADDLLAAIESILRQRERSPEAVRLEVHGSTPKAVRSLDRGRAPRRPRRRLRDPVAARHGRSHGADEARPSRPEVRAVGGRDAVPSAARGERHPRHLQRDRRRATCWSTTRTTRSPPRWSSSSRRRRAIRRCWRSSRPCTGRRARTAASSARWCAPRSPGKQTVALVELTARFDEETNISWARVLEQAGVHVVYGVVGLKTHAKCSLVVREEGDEIRRYCHIGTGNYHSVTAKLYEDVGLLTADPDITADVADLFNYLTGYSHQQAYRRILVAPITLRSRILEMIRHEAEAPGRSHRHEDEQPRRRRA